MPRGALEHYILRIENSPYLPVGIARLRWQPPGLGDMALTDVDDHTPCQDSERCCNKYQAYRGETQIGSKMKIITTRIRGNTRKITTWWIHRHKKARSIQVTNGSCHPLS